MTIRHLPRLDPETWYVIDIDRTEGAAPWRNRGLWLHGPEIEAHLEWSLLTRGFGLGIVLGRNGTESDVGLDIYAGRLGSVWSRLKAPWLKRLRVEKADDDHWYEARHTSVKLFPYRGCIFLAELDSHDNGGPRREVKLTSYALLGKTHSETVDGESGMTNVPLPEGNYPASWVERVVTNTYVGWRFGRLRDAMFGPRTHRYVDLSIENGIPIEGKGENSWDCGMDGLFGCGGSSVADAVGSATAHVLKYRDRYGGPHDLARPMTVKEAGERRRSS